MLKRATSILVALLLVLTPVYAQDPAAPPPPQAPYPSAPPAAPPAAQLLAPAQLYNLVAPIALYPDPLLGQGLAASTYPLEVAEAFQWAQQNNQLRGQQLMDAVRQQNWDASVQALVAFPDALRLLGSNIRWTTDLGNAFLAQQADVMDAVQRLRAQASANGRLRSTPQQTVSTEYQGGQSAIDIQPANPQVLYVPIYNPVAVWGPPAWGAFPALTYSGFFGSGLLGSGLLSSGFGFGIANMIGTLLPGLLGWTGWGWALGWLTHNLFLNGGFFHAFGFLADLFGGGGGHGGGVYAGRSIWEHNPGHRMGVAYPTRALATRYSSRMGNAGFAGRTQMASLGGNEYRNSFSGAGRGESSNYAHSLAPSYNRSNSSNYSRGYSSPGANNFSASRSYAPHSSYSEPRSNYSARSNFSEPRASYSAPRASSFSAKSYSAPKAPKSFSHGGGGGHSSGGGHASKSHGGGGGHSGGHKH